MKIKGGLKTSPHTLLVMTTIKVSQCWRTLRRTSSAKEWLASSTLSQGQVFKLLKLSTLARHSKGGFLPSMGVTQVADFVWVLWVGCFKTESQKVDISTVHAQSPPETAKLLGLYCLFYNYRPKTYLIQHKMHSIFRPLLGSSVTYVYKK